ncbi:tRNA-specific adenosine deaminase [Prauserella marina]|uniref:tRNA(Arg) A34 adenosine deaminase TadA n=1 Tax=Prauserella marina TaxID=530584 RepID=A0A222VKQ6_9PSEU|nr:nucleoside deaminase [Prauserella marina]ASR34505.1 tRNA-specific adenosine deaminase [Prauserella marina]PWV85894.1 tRNA(Arg) A34 adenosine deaminase TadA [Prauserella marina]SDC42932.1 tRNA(Arg) A34 adenosine deaminase TadA [Prauserella marina]
MTITETDLKHLRRCVELARKALADGDEPFGSVLVSPGGEVLFEDHNRVKDGNAMLHPEIAISRWAVDNLARGERAAATVYTSGEHCPMCAASHGWAGLGRIVFAASSAQLGRWLEQWGVPQGPVAPLPITTVVPAAWVEGPVPEFEEEMRVLYRTCFAK